MPCVIPGSKVIKRCEEQTYVEGYLVGTQQSNMIDHRVQIHLNFNFFSNLTSLHSVRQSLSLLYLLILRERNQGVFSLVKKPSVFFIF